MASLLVLPAFVVFLACLGLIGVGLVFRALSGVLPLKLRRRRRRPPELARGVCYHHFGHTWARAAGKGLAAVGLDDLASKIIGRVDGVQLPKVGDLVHQGKTACTLIHKGRAVELVSPVTGRVVAVNQELQRTPGLISRFPSTQGWLFRTRVCRVKEDLGNLLTGALALRHMDLSRAWVCHGFSRVADHEEYQFTCQDGGELVEGLGDSLNDEEWMRLKKILFASP